MLSLSYGKLYFLGSAFLSESNRALADKVNQQRLERAYALLSPHAQKLLDVLPVLFHFNAPQLPGYIDGNVPSHIHHFGEEDYAAICIDFKFDYKKVTVEPSLLLGVYSMGSLGSFAWQPQSDIDIWIVHIDELTPEQCELLLQKSRLIEEYFAEYGVDLNCYLVCHQQFIRGHDQVLSTEHSGSAQHWLLLDEFYRSHIRLAGKPVCWWPCQGKCDDSTLFLGNVHDLPATEYVGASMWQLFKAIDTPHKALLKILLLETYVAEYPNQRLLSDELWERTKEQDFSVQSDSYLLLLQRVSNYLIDEGDLRRLEIVRRCFYLKSGVRLTDTLAKNDWRYETMLDLVQVWGWTQGLIETLDQCDSWSAGQLQWFNQQLDEFLLVSYQRLLDFASKYQLNHGLRHDELGVLARKLHTRHSEEPSRLPYLNPLFSVNLEERALSLIAVHNHKTMAHGYYLYPYQTNLADLLDHSSYFYSTSAVVTVLWACLNGVATDRTKWLDLQPKKSHKNDLKRLAQYFLQVMPEPEQVSLVALRHPWHIQRAFVIVNQLDDPTVDFSLSQGVVNLFHGNLMSLRKSNANLLGSVELFIQNSWGEWHYFTYQGDLALLDALTRLSQGAWFKHDIELSVFSCSAKKQQDLRDFVQFAIHKTLKLFKQSDSNSLVLKIMKIKHIDYALFIERKGIHYHRLDDVEDLFLGYMNNGVACLSRTDDDENEGHKWSNHIHDFAVQGMVQYFLFKESTHVEVVTSNMSNIQQHYQIDIDGLNDLITQVNHSSVFGDGQNIELFNLPQFYWITFDGSEAKIEPIVSYSLRETI